MNRGHCVAADNYFTTFKVAVDLLEKKTTYIGTMKSNKRELPASVKNKERLYNSKFYENDNGLVLSVYQGSKKKNVILLSSHHEKVFIDPEELILKKKPNTIIDYNNTKFGVDSLDQMARFYSVKAPTRRWPLQIFYNILNLASINSWVLYKKILKKKISRRKFLIKLIEEIEETFVAKSNSGGAAKRKEPARETETSEGTPKRVRLVTNEGDELSANEKKPYCQVKYSCSDNKSNRICDTCKKRSCGKCIGVEIIRSKCRKCIENEESQNI